MSIDVTEHYPLGARTTFKVGGSARFYVSVSDERALQDAYLYADQRSVPVRLFGGGSNTLLDDGEAEALFLSPAIMGIEEVAGELIVGAGESWERVVAYAVEAGLYGIENLSGIPGTMGGAAVQNIGAYGAALSEVVQWVEVYDTATRQSRRLTREECAFGYRESVFKHEPNRFIIVRVSLQLSTTTALDIGYRDVALYFADTEPTLTALRRAILAIRAQKFPDLAFEGTAGSFFKNPVVSRAAGEELQRRYPALPLFPLPETAGYKVPLAWILDHILSLRGFAVGSVRCFEKQPLVLVAQRNATAKEVRACAHEIQMRVQKETALVITPEVCVMHGVDIADTLDF